MMTWHKHFISGESVFCPPKKKGYNDIYCASCTEKMKVGSPAWFPLYGNSGLAYHKVLPKVNQTTIKLINLQ